MSGFRPGKYQIISLFIAFAVLFVTAFGLGILVGKGFGRADSVLSISTGDIDKIKHKTADKSAAATPGLPEPPEPPESVVPTPGPVNSGLPEELDEGARIYEDKYDSAENGIEAEIETGTAPEATAAPTPGPESLSEESLPDTDKNGRFTVQIGSFKSREQASAYSSEISAKGYPAFVKTMESSDGTVWYRVRVGTFDTVEKAQLYGGKLKNLEPDIRFIFITDND